MSPLKRSPKMSKQKSLPSSHCCPVYPVTHWQLKEPHSPWQRPRRPQDGKPMLTQLLSVVRQPGELDWDSAGFPRSYSWGGDREWTWGGQRSLLYTEQHSFFPRENHFLLYYFIQPNSAILENVMHTGTGRGSGLTGWPLKLLFNLYASKMIGVLSKVPFYLCHGHAEKWKQKCNIKAERGDSGTSDVSETAKRKGRMKAQGTLWPSFNPHFWLSFQNRTTLLPNSIKHHIGNWWLHIQLLSVLIMNPLLLPRSRGGCWGLSQLHMPEGRVHLWTSHHLTRSLCELLGVRYLAQG